MRSVSAHSVAGHSIFDAVNAAIMLAINTAKSLLRAPERVTLCIPVSEVFDKDDDTAVIHRTSMSLMTSCSKGVWRKILAAYPAKDSVLAIQPRSRHCCDEEL